MSWSGDRSASAAETSRATLTRRREDDHHQRRSLITTTIRHMMQLTNGLTDDCRGRQTIGAQSAVGLRPTSSVITDTVPRAGRDDSLTRSRCKRRTDQ